MGIVTSKSPGSKMVICHNGKPITINSNAWPAHKAHEDLQGECSNFATTTICNQIWMVRNLDVSTYRNGDLIPEVTDPAAWASLTTGAWCYNYNNPEYGAIFGKLYNWYAVNDPRGLAPEGWHVPSFDEWETLINCLGGEFVAGGKMKQTGTTYWLSPNEGATNESGFTGLPAELRFPDGEFRPPMIFPFVGTNSSWWSTTEYNFNSMIYARHKSVDAFSAGIQNAVDDKRYGYSVRCIRIN